MLKQVGSLIESPSYYGHLSGEENLRIGRSLPNVPKGDYLILPLFADTVTAGLSPLLEKEHLSILRLEERQKRLEDIFLALTGKAVSL